MPTEPQKDDSSRNPLPFEPTKSRKKPEKKSVAAASANTTTAKAAGSKQNQGDRITRAEMAIPEVVSRRMVRRMALFCGIPSALGISTFFVSYFVVSNDLIALPNAAVVLVSMGFFGLGVLGLSYGVISASWDEENPGSKLGWSEFTTNFGRLTEAWRNPKGTASRSADKKS